MTFQPTFRDILQENFTCTFWSFSCLCSRYHIIYGYAAGASSIRCWLFLYRQAMSRSWG